MSVLNGIGGLSHGSFFRVSDTIDTSKTPGTTTPAPPKDPLQEMVWILTGQAFLYSPNLVWFLMACGVWFFLPYDLQQRPGDDETMTLTSITMHRLVINHLLAFGYIGFWHVMLYVFHICQRPFNPNREYKLEKVLHNMFYTWLGVLHWTATEIAFIYCYRSGRLEYVPDIFQNLNTVIHTLLLSMLVPAYRDIHFYFCHRLIHIRFLYKYVHSLHHRNTDIEPFAGLCMHPVEHLYYFTCYGPFLVLPKTSPFVLFWMGFHTALSPAASHSGWEDHFSADLAHYLHHRYCECNYSGGINFDRYFGTYQTTLKPSSTKIPSESKATSTEEQSILLSPSPIDSKATLVGLPEYPLYQLGLLVMCVRSVVSYRNGFIGPHLTAIVLSMGHAIWALCLAVVTRPGSLSWRKLLLAPFDKDSTLSLSFHIGLGFLLGVVPATYLLDLILSPVAV